MYWSRNQSQLWTNQLYFCCPSRGQANVCLWEIQLNSFLKHSARHADMHWVKCYNWMVWTIWDLRCDEYFSRNPPDTFPSSTKRVGGLISASLVTHQTLLGIINTWSKDIAVMSFQKKKNIMQKWRDAILLLTCCAVQKKCHQIKDQITLSFMHVKLY